MSEYLKLVLIPKVIPIVYNRISVLLSIFSALELFLSDFQIMNPFVFKSNVKFPVVCK